MKLEARSVIAMTTVIAIVITGETNNGDDLPLMLRRMDRLRSKIRLWINYSETNSLMTVLSQKYYL